MPSPVSDEAFARYVNQIGNATFEQIEAAKAVQAENAAKGITLSLGEVLVQQGILTTAIRENVEKKLQAQAAGGVRQLGNYKPLKKLGEGGMGAVYLAQDTMLDRKVALKILPRKYTENAEFLARFRREAKATGRLNHPNIVGAYAVDEDQGHHYYVMEYCEGETLDALLKRQKVLPEDLVIGIAIQVVQGLGYAHGHNFIHRDIKPGNIFLTREGVAKILDLGLSKNVADAEQSFQTVSGTALGTPHYISPEQAQGAKNVDGRADIYSLGATLYHLLTGQTPFSASTAAAIMIKHISEQLPDPRDVRPDLSEGIVHIICKAMAKAPEDRYANMGELLVDLEQVKGGQAPSSAALDAGLSSIAMRRAAAVSAPAAQAPLPAPGAGAVAGAPPAGSPAGVAQAPSPAPPLPQRGEGRDARATAGLPSSVPGRGAGVAQAPPPARRERRSPAAPPPEAPPLSALLSRRWYYAIGGGVAAVVVLGVILAFALSGDSKPEKTAGRTPPPSAISAPKPSPDEARKVEPNVPEPKPPEPKASEEYDPRATVAASLLEQAKAYLRAHPEDPAGYRDKLADLTGRYARTPAAEEAARLVAGLKIPEKPDAFLRPNETVAEYAKRMNLAPETTLDLGGGVKMEMVLVPSGEFDMGSNDGQGNEKPIHRVKISKARYMGKYEVTVAQFRAFADATKYVTEGEKFGKGVTWKGERWQEVDGVNWRAPGFPQEDNHPVCVIAWNDAQEFCKWAGKKTGRDVCLPTEAQWEYACRAGATTRFNTTDKESDLEEAAWFNKNSGMHTNAVGQKKANAWGLYDMHGNVWEWVQDYFNDSYYQESPTVDPQGPATVGARVLRGGSWNYPPGDGRAARRGRASPGDRQANCGLRVVLDLARGPTAADDAWIASIKALPPEEQVKKVVEKLKELNPEYDEKETHKVAEGKVTEFYLGGKGKKVTDISPLRALAGLRKLDMAGTCADLSPVGDLKELRSLMLWGSNAKDLSPLKGLQLEWLNCGSGSVADLSPLSGMPLKFLCATPGPVTDLSPLQGMKLTGLMIGVSQVRDLSPLRGMPLTVIYFEGSPVADISPLQDMPLQEVKCSFKPERDAAVLKAIKTLTRINQMPAEEFWKKQDTAAQASAGTQPATMQPEPAKALDPQQTTQVAYGQFLLGFQALVGQKGWALARARVDDALKNPQLAARAETLKLDGELLALTERAWQAIPKGAALLADGRAFTLEQMDGKLLRLGEDAKTTVKKVQGETIEIQQDIGGGKITVGVPCSKLTFECACDLARLGLPPDAEGKLALALLKFTGPRGKDPAQAAKEIGFLLQEAAKEKPLEAKVARVRAWQEFTAKEGLADQAWQRAEAIFAARKMWEAKDAYDAFQREHGQNATAAVQAGLLKDRYAAIKAVLGQLTLDLGGGVKMEFVLVPAGEFEMGSNDGPPEEKPAHKVRISKPFYMGKYEVTLAQFRAFAEATKYETTAEKAGRGLRWDNGWQDVAGINWMKPNFPQEDNYPVCVISWNDTQEFCKWVTKVAGRTARLPTEAEWEYACRGGATTRFNTGDKDSDLEQAGWFNKNSGMHTNAVGQKKPNALGLYDMHGNVQEWVQDCASDKYYTDSPLLDPKGPATGGDRMLRGGSWGDGPDVCRAAHRGWHNPGWRIWTWMGFRMVVDMAAGGTGAVVQPEGAPTPMPAPAAFLRPKETVAEYAKRTNLRPGITLDFGGDAKMELALVPPGEFEMGQKGAAEPVHHVTITRPFYLGKYEVTQTQYQKVMSVNPSSLRKPNMPVETVTWDDAQEFCKKASATTGVTVRLPTEAEWEYACRAGTQTTYYTGDSDADLDRAAWHEKNSNGTTHPGGLKAPNAWGLYDMHGNLWEWCADWLGAYRAEAATDPQGPAQGQSRVFRGGSWSNPCRSADRDGRDPGHHSAHVGFRVVGSLPKAP